MKIDKVKIFPLVAAMTIIAAVAAALLGWVYLVTAAPIKNAQIQKTNAALRDVLPAFDNQPGDEAVTAGNVTFYTARNAGKIVGFAGETVTPKGYNGGITVLAGLTPDGKITTVLVTQQAETPGLGTVVTDRKRQKTISGILSGAQESGLPPNRVLDQFSGMQVNAGDVPWTVKKDGGTLDAVTGATITSRAVADAVYTIAATFTNNRDAIINAQ
ncbi:MAG: RnfABCDGE type electron transport complex subunit G [Kiritimatiellales bacterium]